MSKNTGACDMCCERKQPGCYRQCGLEQQELCSRINRGQDPTAQHWMGTPGDRNSECKLPEVRLGSAGWRIR
jgi:hypothetical protein